MEENKQIQRPPLPVTKIFTEALRFPFCQNRQFWIWVIILCFLSLGMTVAGNYFILAMLRDLPFRIMAGGAMVLDGLESGLVFTLLGITCHRMILLEEQKNRWTEFFRWSHRETRFFIWSFLIYIVVILIMMLFIPLGMVSHVILKAGLRIISDYFTNEGIKIMGFRVWTLGFVSIMYFLFLFLISRVSLVLPATAIDGSPTLSSAWDLAMGNGWRLTLIVGTIPFLALVVLFLKVLMPQFPTFPILSAVNFLDLFDFLPRWIREIGEILFSLLISIFEIALLSEAYKKLVPLKEIPQGELSSN